MNTSLTIRAAVVLLGLACLQTAAGAAAPDAQALALFESKIRPVLVKECYQCHSAEAARNRKLRGGLQLDTRQGMRKGGDSGPAVVPGDPKKSLLLAALRHDGKVEKMPPRKKLPDAVIADFVRWVRMGAPDPRDGPGLPARRTIDIAQGKKHWAFAPLSRVRPPEVKNGAWVRNPIDRFLLARLEAQGLAPAPALGRGRLLRRVTFDLTGLPPTPEEIDAFAAERSPDAYERLVDRLLQSGRYGERWGRHWLDVARFAESGGYEFDGDRPGAYHYRDWVIKALNQDLPFDEFVRLQIAGDHLKPGDLEATAATGFLVAGPYPGQTTAKTREPIRYDHLDDMISTVGTALLGLTVGCARCHEHKYDPIPQQDYYHLIACLARTDSNRYQLDADPERTRQARAAFEKAHAPLLAARAKFEKEELPGRLARWSEAEKKRPAPTWLVLDVEAPGRAPFKKLSDGSLLTGSTAETVVLVGRTFQKGITALRLEALPDQSLPRTGPGRAADGSFRLLEVKLTAEPLASKGRPVLIKLRPGRAIDGTAGKPAAVLFELETPFDAGAGAVLGVTLKFARGKALGRLRLAISTARPARLDGEARPQHGAEVLALLAGKQHEQIVRWFRAVDARTSEVLEAVEKHTLLAPKPKLVPVFAATSGRGGDVHYLIRGETGRKNGVARPGFVQVLTNSADGDRRWVSSAAGPPRIALANWLTDSEHGAGHLLARVIVNRLWQHHFGKGLVRTPNDFGAQGERPSHPELLDWLAAELIRAGWKLKPIHRLIVTSAAYRQGSTATGTGEKASPGELLWGQVPARRLEAEAIRDALLAASGELDTTMFGPGSLDENSPRRSVYLTVKRSRLLPLLQMFDAPEAIQSVGERQTTTGTPQALALLNSRFVRQRAEKLAQRAGADRTEGLSGAVERAYLLALGRRPTAAEKEKARSFIQRAAGKGPSATWEALVDFCQVLLCASEFLYID